MKIVGVLLRAALAEKQRNMMKHNSTRQAGQRGLREVVGGKKSAAVKGGWGERQWYRWATSQTPMLVRSAPSQISVLVFDNNKAELLHKKAIGAAALLWRRWWRRRCGSKKKKKKRHALLRLFSHASPAKQLHRGDCSDNNNSRKDTAKARSKHEKSEMGLLINAPFSFPRFK